MQQQPLTGAPDLRAELERTQSYLAQDPDNLSLLARAIDQAITAGDAVAARAYADHALRLRPGDPFFAFRAARVLVAERDYDAAIPALEALLAAHPSVHIASVLAQCHIAQGRHVAAADLLAPFGADPEMTQEAAVQLVRSLHHAGRLDEARTFIERETARFGDNPYFNSAASLIYFDLSDAPTARRLADKASAQGAEPIEALVVQASLALVDDRARAKVLFDKVLAVSPNEGRSWVGLGMASMMNRDFRAAQAQLERARQAMPAHIGTMHTLAWCRLFQDDIDGAAREFEAALAQDRTFGESHGGIATIHAVRGEREEAEREIEVALRLDPASLSARYAQMVLSGVTRDPERFREMTMRLLAQRPMSGGGTVADAVRRNAL